MASSPLSRPTVLLIALSMFLAYGCPDDEPSTDAGSPADTRDARDARDAVDAADTADTNDTDDNDDVADTTDTTDRDGDATPSDGDTGAERTIALPDLGAEVTARFDSSGVLHLECERAVDCFAAQGYFHADERFVSMDVIRRQTRGQLATLIGSLALQNDRKFRHLMTTRDGEPLEEAYLAASSDRTKTMLRAYARGVNTWLDDVENGENGAELTGEYDSNFIDGEEIRDWEPEDSIALYLQLAHQLGNSSQDDLFRGDLVEAVGREVAGDLANVQPAFDSNIIGASGGTGPGAIRSGLGGDDAETPDHATQRIERRLAPAGRAIDDARDWLRSSPSLVFGPNSNFDGSNNWALGPGRTSSGDALLANDPHLSLNNPPIWYMVELRTTGADNPLHVAGASIPSVPGVVVGHNEHVAWGVTTARYDQADAYVETLTDDGTAVERDGGTVDILTKEYTLEVSGGDARTETFEWVPGHGPIVSKDPEQNRAISIKWVAHEPGPDLDFIQPLMRAESVQEAMDAMEPARAINQNWVFADRDGSIAWYPKSTVPSRPWASASTPNWLPLPGDGSAEWQGTIPTEDLPKLVDPPEGFIATANNDMDGSYADGDGTNGNGQVDHEPWQYPPTHGSRHARIVERIRDGGNDHTVETMHDIQADTHSLPGDRLVPHVLDAVESSGADLSERESRVVSALENWNYSCPTGLQGIQPGEADPVDDASTRAEAAGCAVFHVLLPRLTDEAFGDELEPADTDPFARWNDFQNGLVLLFDSPSDLDRGDAYFDDVGTPDVEETEADVVVAAIERTAQALPTLFDGDTVEDWLWGRIHTVTFSSLLSRLLSGFDSGPYANDGGWATIDMAPPEARGGAFDDDYNHTIGPSTRVVFRAGDDGIDGWFQLPGRQQHRGAVDNAGDLAQKWLGHEPTQLRFGPEEVADDTVRTVVVTPGP